MSVYRKAEISYREFPNGYLFANGVGINEVAFSIWEYCGEKTTEEEMINFMIGKFNPIDETDMKMIKSDTIECIESLVEVSLFERVE